MIENNVHSNGMIQQVFFIDDIEKIIGRNRLTLRRWWSVGKFPKPVKLNESTLAWHRDAIEAWIDKNIKLCEA